MCKVLPFIWSCYGTVYPGKSGSGLNRGINGNGADEGTSISALGLGGGATSQICLCTILTIDRSRRSEKICFNFIV